MIVSRFTFLFWKREASLYPEDRYQEHEGLGRRASVDTLPVYMPKPADIELHELPNYSSSVTIVTVDTSQSHSQDLDSNSAGQELAINSADNEHVRSSTGSVPVEPLDDVPLVPSVLSRRPQ